MDESIPTSNGADDRRRSAKAPSRSPESAIAVVRRKHKSSLSSSVHESARARAESRVAPTAAAKQHRIAYSIAAGMRCNPFARENSLSSGMRANRFNLLFSAEYLNTSIPEPVSYKKALAYTSSCAHSDRSVGQSSRKRCCRSCNGCSGDGSAPFQWLIDFLCRRFRPS